jgi:hypothetical protein
MGEMRYKRSEHDVVEYLQIFKKTGAEKAIFLWTEMK